jgi:hypothetical protein
MEKVSIKSALYIQNKLHEGHKGHSKFSELKMDL